MKEASVRISNNLQPASLFTFILQNKVFLGKFIAVMNEIMRLFPVILAFPLDVTENVRRKCNDIFQE
jgi:hypothetical protein